MTSPPPRLIADFGGVAVAERGPLIIVVDRGTGGWTTTAFVFGVLAVVVGGFGAVTLALAATGGTAIPWWVCSIFVLVGVVLAGATSIVVRRIRSVRRRPVGAYEPVVVFDRARRVVIDADGTVLATLDEIRFDTRMQATSSSPMLVMMTPGGPRIVKRGNPFDGGLGNLEAVLTAAIFGPPPRRGGMGPGRLAQT